MDLGSTSELVSLGLVVLTHFGYVVSRFAKLQEAVKSLSSRIDQLEQQDLRHEQRLETVLRMEGKLDIMLVFIEQHMSKEKH